MPSSIKDNVKTYYSDTLTSNKDLKSSACCSTDTLPKHHRNILAQISPEIIDKFYGCGAPLPPDVDSAHVLDLGCGTGRDVYLLSKLVGRNGHVIGIDMTPEQLQVAEKHKDYQAKTFEYTSSNVQFILADIEDLSHHIPNDSIDLVISNCVINLSTNKPAVFKEIFRVLKPGGELYFSDVFSDRRIPEALQKDPVLYGECLSGALYIEDFRRHLLDIGCAHFHTMSSRTLEINNPDIKAKINNIKFTSSTIRAFKLDLEDREENYGQTLTYLGTIPENPDTFQLDHQTVFQTNQKIPISGNTATILQKSRYSKHFKIDGTQSTHHGQFTFQTPTQKSVKPSCC